MLNRRALIMAGLAGGSSLAMARLTRAQNATPTSNEMLIPPLRWDLERISGNAGTQEPNVPTSYWIQLLPDGTLIYRADCNQGSGTYAIDAASLSFSELVSTRVACAPGSISDVFIENLGYVASWQITGDLSDQLVLNLMADGGSLTFFPVLQGVTWEWTQFEGGDGSVVTAVDPSRYTLTILEDSTIQVVADCNRGFGQATLDASGAINITVGTTRMGCPPDSQATDFLRYLDEAVSYVISGGMLHLALPADAGIASFRPTIPAASAATPEP